MAVTRLHLPYWVDTGVIPQSTTIDALPRFQAPGDYNRVFANLDYYDTSTGAVGAPPTCYIAWFDTLNPAFTFFTQNVLNLASGPVEVSRPQETRFYTVFYVRVLAYDPNFHLTLQFRSVQ